MLTPCMCINAPRWSTNLGIPEEDMQAWGDTCPNYPGYDELGNFMTYSYTVCRAALGHFTPGQVGTWVGMVTAERQSDKRGNKQACGARD